MMNRQNCLIDSGPREIVLSLGRCALVCCLFVMPLRTAETMAHRSVDTDLVASAAVWWAPTEEARGRCFPVRDGLGGSIPATVVAWWLPPCVSDEPSRLDPARTGLAHNASLVGLEVRLQV